MWHQTAVEGMKELEAEREEALRVAGDRFAPRYRRGLSRYRYGPGAFKVDWALDRPIPWSVPECSRAATVHLGGTLEEIAYTLTADSRCNHERLSTAVTLAGAGPLAQVSGELLLPTLNTKSLADSGP